MKAIQHLIFMILLFPATVVLAQSKPSVPDLTVQHKFDSDLRSNNIAVYIIGGLVSAIRSEERAFMKKYQVVYHDFGCVVPANIGYYARYNELLFDYLKARHGQTWQKEIHPNTLGFSNWIKK